MASIVLSFEKNLFICGGVFTGIVEAILLCLRKKSARKTKVQENVCFCFRNRGSERAILSNLDEKEADILLKDIKEQIVKNVGETYKDIVKIKEA